MVSLLAVAAPKTNPTPGASPPASLMVLFSLMLAILVLARRLAWTLRARQMSPPPEKAASRADMLPAQEVNILERSEPTAIFLVGGGAEQDPRTLQAFAETYSRQYQQVLLLAVGVVDASNADDDLPSWQKVERSEETKALRRVTRLALDPHLEAAHRLGLKADCRISIAVNPALEMARLIDGVVRNFPRAMFFLGRPVPEHARWYDRVLPSASTDNIRGFLERKGVPVTVIPVVDAANQMNAVERN